MLNAITSDLVLDLLEKFIAQHTGNYRVIDVNSDVEQNMTLHDVWDFFGGMDDAAPEACQVISEMLVIQDESNHILKSNGWIVKKLN